MECARNETFGPLNSIYQVDELTPRRRDELLQHTVDPALAQRIPLPDRPIAGLSGVAQRGADRGVLAEILQRRPSPLDHPVLQVQRRDSLSGK